MIDPKDPADMSQEEHEYWEKKCLEVDADDLPEPSDEKISTNVRRSILAAMRYLGIEIK